MRDMYHGRGVTFAGMSPMREYQPRSKDVTYIGAMIDCVLEKRPMSGLPLNHPARKPEPHHDLMPRDPVTGERDICKSEMPKWTLTI